MVIDNQLTELTEQYLPDEFLFRENQIKAIETTFLQFKEKKPANNLIILGTTGAGKTSILQKIIEQNDNCVYISAGECKTTHKILRKMAGEKIHANSDLINHLIIKFNETPKILVIDEVGKIDDVAYFCDVINAFFRGTRTPIILATNKWTWVEEMPSDAKLTLFLQKVEFPCYHTIQLKEILNKRLELVKEKTDFRMPSGSLEYLCARVIKEFSSSVRIALLVLNQCINMRQGSQSFIDEKLNYLTEQDWKDFIHKLNDTEKEFLNVILDLSETLLEIPTPEISAKMTNLVSPSRISQLTTTFINYGIIKMEWKFLGRAGGKHRLICFSRPEYRVKLQKLLSPWEQSEELKIEV